MEKTWEPVGHTLQDIVVRCRELGAAPDPRWNGLPVAELGAVMRAAEAKERVPCDELLRNLVRPGGVMGTLPPLRSYFCLIRALCALDTLGILHAELRSRPLYPEPPNWTSDELLEWLLVSNWQHRHDTWLKLCAYAVATGNAFYSG
jgi:hypothetical protein